MIFVLSALFFFGTVTEVQDPFVGVWELIVSESKVASDSTLPARQVIKIRSGEDQGSLLYSFYTTEEENGKEKLFEFLDRQDKKEYPTEVGRRAGQKFISEKKGERYATRTYTFNGKVVRKDKTIVSEDNNLLQITTYKCDSRGCERESAAYKYQRIK
jgi:hypothetical protein